jgi:hypothetical protein
MPKQKATFFEKKEEYKPAFTGKIDVKPRYTSLLSR